MRPMEIKDIELKRSLSIPSTMNSYSMGIEYIKNWFLSKFSDDYFKTVHIDSKHILDDFRNMDPINILKADKPAVAIIPNIELSHDRDHLDTYLYDMGSYIRKGVFRNCFFKDFNNKVFLDIRLEEIKIEFNIRIKVSTRAQQVDLYKFMSMVYRIKATQGEYIDMDYHVPYSVMIQLANDTGFAIEDNKVVNILEFLGYLNNNSVIPFLYKYRTINGRSEFFIRLRDSYVHISTLDALSNDDGEREGMLMNNYGIDMNCTLSIPAPKFYVYYSGTEHNIDKLTLESSDGLYNINVPKVPMTTNKGWQQYLSTECYEEDRSKPLSIEFTELIENSDLEKVIKHHITTFLSPYIFIEFKLFNDGKEIEHSINWETMTLTTKMELKSEVTSIIIYIDLKYMTDSVIQINELYSNRIK